MAWGKRGSTNTNDRGSAEARRRRKRWLLATFDVDLGPELARCSFDECDEILDFESITVDRFPVRGADGGRYTRDNIRPACSTHNCGDGSADGSRRAHAAKAAGRCGKVDP